jgi:hypothetical protein
LARRESALRAGEGDSAAVQALAAAARADLAFVRAHPAGLRTLDLARGEAELLRLEGKLEEARRLQVELARVAPHAEAPPALAALALAQGDPDEAFRQAMSSIDLARGLGPAYAAERAPDTPEEHVARAIRQHARSAAGLVAIEGLAGRYTDWEARLAERKSTAAAYAQRALGELRRAARLEREGELEDALAALARADQSLGFSLTIAPDLGDARLDRVELALERARVLDLAGRGEEAAAALLEARAHLAELEGAELEGTDSERGRELADRLAAAAARR